MFRNVVSALNEAQDIALHLKPLAGMFQVKSNFEQIWAYTKHEHHSYFFRHLKLVTFQTLFHNFAPWCTQFVSSMQTQPFTILQQE